MIAYKEAEISDKEWVDRLLRLSDFRGTEYCFTNIFVWKVVYRIRIAQWNDFLLIRADDGGQLLDIFPGGTGDIKALIDKLMDDAFVERRDFRMAVVGAEKVALMQQLYPADFFDITPDRNGWDYIYKVEDLTLLPGKRYQPKRNHIARFTELPDWRYEPITMQNLAECMEMNVRWNHQSCATFDQSLYDESCAVETGLRHFKALGLEGALLRVSGKVVAYTLGEPLNSDTYIVHVEKAFSEFKGAYQMINREFIRHNAASFAYVNREDDAGDEGLRTAKNSYHPHFMEEKYFFAVPYNSLSLRR